MGPLRGFLPRGLFDACSQAPQHAHTSFNEGRHRIAFNVAGRSLDMMHAEWESPSDIPVVRRNAEKRGRAPKHDLLLETFQFHSNCVRERAHLHAT
jgi:hypothetical protein